MRGLASSSSAAPGIAHALRCSQLPCPSKVQLATLRKQGPGLEHPDSPVTPTRHSATPSLPTSPPVLVQGCMLEPRRPGNAHSQPDKWKPLLSIWKLNGSFKYC